MRRLSMIAVLAVVVLVAAPAAFAVTITLNGAGTSYIRTVADAGTLTASVLTVNPASLPTAGAPPPAVDGANVASTTYNLSNASFNLTFSHDRGAAYASFAQSYGHIFFSPATDVNYVLSGAYSSNATDTGTSTFMTAEIYDYSTSDSVFINGQYSVTTSGESFVLGQTGGDSSNQLAGSLTGSLIAGHQYDLYFMDYINSTPNAATTAAQATGYLNLTFVPEPTTAALLGLGFTGLAAAGRKRRSAH
jgi:hypothetical protein